MTKTLNARVLLSVGVILAMAAAALGATYAAWSASDSIDGENTISTAVLRITAVGAAGGNGTVPALPFNEVNVLPGDVTDPEERALVTNDSSIDLDLYMYVTTNGSGACDATKLAWQSSRPSSSDIWGGYLPGSEPTDPGTYGADDGHTNFTRLANIDTLAEAVMIANASQFTATGPTETVAVRQIAGFATDAIYGTHSGSCEWSLNFVGVPVGQSITL